MEPTAKRPWYLTVLLVLTIVYYLLGAVMMGILPVISAQLAPELVFPVWYSVSTVILLLIGIAGAAMVFAWKKLGLYLLVATAVLSIVLDYSGAGQSTVSSVIVSLIPAALIYLSMRPMWHSFK